MNADKIVIKIRGQDWKVRLVTSEKFAKTVDDKAAAVTIMARKEIVFNNEDLDLNTVIHELVHAYYHAGCTLSADLTPDQTEELMCELFGEFGAEIIRVSRRLLKHLKEMAKELE
jgi:hypothetical protein